MPTEERFKIPKWGPRKLRDIFKLIEDAINARTPKAGFGAEISQDQDGSRIYIQGVINSAIAVNDSGGGGGGGGTPVVLYGAYNGAPAIFHLLQSTAPTSP